MSRHFADRLTQAIREKRAAVCVGLDPLVERLPPALRALAERSSEDALVAYGRGVIAAVAGLVPAIKINIAFFEPYHEAGLRAYRTLTRDAHRAGLIVIGDIKRADIGHSSQRYATAHVGRDHEDEVDAVTVNPYFGTDGVGPFVETAARNHRGVFVLVQTSNHSAAQVQGLVLPDGSTVCQKVAQLVQSWATQDGGVGECGYGCVGAVVSPRDLPSTRRIRELMPQCLFLVPGFGAQGRTAEEVAQCFKPDGSGAIVTASRSVIFAYEDAPVQALDWTSAVAGACQEFVTTIRQLTHARTP